MMRHHLPVPCNVVTQLSQQLDRQHKHKSRDYNRNATKEEPEAKEGPEATC